jgi:acyl phosphate:glycerol-3-phosphate acyltransferase
MKMILFSSLIALGYCVGALPTGFWIAYAKGIHDITKHGSGNIGATNVSRLFGIYYFFLVFFLDSAKAFLYLVMLQYGDVPEMIQVGAAIGLLVGNGYSIFLKGYGGKGLATSVGILMALAPQVLFILVIIWGLALVVTRTVGITSVIALGLLPCIAWYYVSSNNLLYSLLLFMSLWGIWRHRENIMKYLKRTG